MKILKKIILSLLLSKQERIVIWNSLWFSNHTYCKRGKVNEATDVQLVMKKVEYIFGIENQKFTKKEVQEIIDDTIKSSSSEIFSLVFKQYEKGFKAGEKNFKDNLNKIMNDVILEDSKKNEEAVKTDNKNTSFESNAADDGVNYEKN